MKVQLVVLGKLKNKLHSRTQTSDRRAHILDSCNEQITLVVSDMKATALEKSRPCLESDVFKASKGFAALPMLTIGMSKNRVQTSPLSESRTLTKMMHDLSVLSFDSSIMIENGLLILVRTLLR